MKRLLLFLTVLITVLSASAYSVKEGEEFELVTNANSLNTSDIYILCYIDNVMGSQNGTAYRNRVASGVTISDNKATITKAGEAAVAFKLVKGTSNAYYAFNVGTDAVPVYLYNSSNGNGSIKENASVTNECNVTISITTDGTATIPFVQKATDAYTNRFQYNSTSNQERFTNYQKSTQKDCKIYRKIVPDQLGEIEAKIGDETLVNGGSKAVAEGTQVILDCQNAVSLTVLLNDDEQTVTTIPYTLTINSDTELIAYATGKDGEESEWFEYNFTIKDVRTFKMITSNDDLEEDAYYVIVNNNSGNAMATTAESDKIDPTSIKITNNTFEADDNVLILQLKKNGNNWGLLTTNYKGTNGYLNPSTSGVNLTVVTTFTSVPISIASNGTATIGVSSGRHIRYNSNMFRSYGSSTGSVVQLYKEVTSPQEFKPEFAPLPTLRPEYTADIKVTNTKYPTITYTVTEGSDVISVTGNTITALKEGTATIKAEWAEDDKWQAGSTTFDVKVLQALVDGQLSFRHEKVVGKFGVGVVSQAAYYAGDRTKITYTSSDPSIVAVHAKTGMIRTDDIKSIGEVTITATVPETDQYKADSKSYIVVIEEPETPAPILSDAKFDFSNDYGMTHFDSNNTSTNDAPFESEVTEIEDNGLKLEFGGRYRWFNDDHMRLYAEDEKNNKPAASLTFTAPEGGSLESIEFASPNSSISKLKPSEGEIKGTLWEAPNGNITSVTFTVTEQVRISTINIKLFTPDETASRQLSDLSFEGTVEGKERIINTFVGKTETLPVLNYNVPFDHLEFNIDEIDEGEDKENPNYGIEVISSEANGEKTLECLNVTVNTPGVYTFRAFNNTEKYDDYFAGMAILRLNVFPNLSVLPTNDGKLADDERTQAPELTLVHPDEENGTTATITIPNLQELLDQDPAKFSTIQLLDVFVKDGEKEQKISDASYTFENDGYIKYILQYADTEDFVGEATVHVVVMPQEPAKDDAIENQVKLTASKNAQLYYRTFLWDPYKETETPYSGSTLRITPYADATPVTWTKVENGETTIELPNDVPAGKSYAVKYMSVKDISDIVGEENGELSSNEGFYTFDAEPVNITMGSFDALQWEPEFALNGASFSEILLASDPTSDLSGVDFTVTVTPAWSDPQKQPEDWSKDSGLTSWQWNQMTSIQDTGEDENSMVDGYYKEPTITPSVSFTEAKGTISGVQFPCSGLYTIEITSPSELYVIDESSKVQNINVYPSLTNQYTYQLKVEEDGSSSWIDREDDGLSINYTAITNYDDPDYGMTMDYPTSDGEVYDAENLNKSLLIVPGLYLADIYYTYDGLSSILGNSSQMRVRRAASENLPDGYLDGYYPVTDNTMNLSGMTIDNPITLSLLVTKNGAYIPSADAVKLKISPSKGLDVPTGIDVIGVEDGEVEYYDLNGFRVNPENLEKGIYIRVCNGKAEKVMK